MKRHIGSHVFLIQYGNGAKLDSGIAHHRKPGTSRFDNIRMSVIRRGSLSRSAFSSSPAVNADGAGNGDGSGFGSGSLMLYDSKNFASNMVWSLPFINIERIISKIHV